MNTFDTLQKIVQTRRSIKPADMNSKKIAKAVIKQLLELADWAPTHATTEPWRFLVYEQEALAKFCADHAELYKAHTPAEKFTVGKYENLLHIADKVSHLVLVYMKRTEGATIPALEEMAAVAAAIENLLLGAASLDIAALWSTGGMAHHPSMKDYLGLTNEDKVMGLLYLGYTDEPRKQGKRKIALENKIVWK